jgi:hypothetical protein
MLRRATALAVLALAVSACAPSYELAVNWTIDGEDPAATCANLPSGTAIFVVAESREDHDERNEAPSITESELACDKGSGSVTIGSFADVRVELRNGDDIFGVSGVVNVVGGGANQGYAASDGADFNVRLTKGTLEARLTVNGQDCGDAGAGDFTVSLFENTEPRTFVAVEEGKTVACADGVALYRFSPVNLNSGYLVTATTSAGGSDFVTSADGEGVEANGAVTSFVVDLAAVDE